MRYLLILFALLAACDDGSNLPATPAWEIGPVINGKNYSINSRVDGHPEGWSLDIGPDAGPHYATIQSSLAGKTRMVMRYRVEAAPETIIYGKGCTSPSAVTLYFQRRGDDWSTDGWRWWATFASKELKGAGEGEIIAPLDGPWTSVRTMTAATAPEQFAAAKRDTGRVGFTFANCEGYGHGARATGPVKFIVTQFRVD